MNKSQPALREMAFGMDAFKVSMAECRMVISSVDVAGCLILKKQVTLSEPELPTNNITDSETLKPTEEPTDHHDHEADSDSLIHILDLPSPNPLQTPEPVLITLLKLLAPEPETNFGQSSTSLISEEPIETQLKDKQISLDEFESFQAYLHSHGLALLSSNLLPYLKSRLEPTALFTYLQSLLQHNVTNEDILALASLRISENSGRTARPSTTRKIKIEHIDEQIKLNEPALVSDNLGLKTWGSSLVLAEFITERLKVLNEQDLLKGSILELGSGTGLTGITIAKLGYKITMTDLPEITPNLETNVILNNCEDIIDVEVLDWTNPESFYQVKGQDVKYDTIIIADPIYSPQHPLWVTNMICSFLKKDPDSRVLLQIPLRQMYEKEREVLWGLIRDRGLVAREELQVSGWDEFGDDILNTLQDIFKGIELLERDVFSLTVSDQILASLSKQQIGLLCSTQITDTVPTVEQDLGLVTRLGTGLTVWDNGTRFVMAKWSFITIDDFP
ncbi:hypothetical protein WICPIJ_001255 [Wickerhamomyces pijperi]|uniref:Uncharacterized protein n=1 Tax=Wickerhamomyces pijperi TaxID=599730 RepID=A0A9P8QB95_WICPI|nr:hypothetical protein WICPIJ_001255 [Wickerhamomyces pijperi]